MTEKNKKRSVRGNRFPPLLTFSQAPFLFYKKIEKETTSSCRKMLDFGEICWKISVFSEFCAYPGNSLIRARLFSKR